MTTSSRGVRVFWLLGVILLLGSALGASWMLNLPAPGIAQTPPGEPPIRGVVGSGFVDVENGVRFLHPLQQGEVKAAYFKEGDAVKKGDIIISIDNKMQTLKLREAEADLEGAQQKLKEAETQLPKKRETAIEKQKAQLAVARSELKSAENEQKIAEAQFKEDRPLISKELLEMTREKVKAREAAVKGHEAALKEIEDTDPQGTIDIAKSNVKHKQVLCEEAQLAVSQCDLKAPADGVILRLFATPGEVMTSQPRQYAVHFCPDTPRIIRVEFMQEYAGKIQKGQLAIIEDDTRSTLKWKGKVERVSDWFTHRRSILNEPFQYNDVRTLECIVSLDPGSPPIRINQKVRVIVVQGGI